MTIQEMKNRGLLLFESISGSRAYGTDLPQSDTDFRGVFIMPKNYFYGLQEITQINDATNDKVYYELSKFLELLAKSNPNMLEMLAMPTDCVQYQHPLFERFKASDFLSKRCQQTFAGYALSQVKKARGLNKKIVNPMRKERKSVLNFCYVIEGHGSIDLEDWLTKNNFKQEHCGLVKIDHFSNIYAVFYDAKNEHGFKGIMKKETANEVLLSSVPKGVDSVKIMSFNKDGYQVYCKDYRNYWEWVAKRNVERYANTVQHGKNYDAKNMMHTFRLLDMAAEIAREKQIVVRRPNRDFLLKIRKGDFEYQELLERAEAKIAEIETLYTKSDLPEQPDLEK
ncbi:MAG: putative nucleotidyltransferase, partial [Saprospiraceae bacterium]